MTPVEAINLLVGLTVNGEVHGKRIDLAREWQKLAEAENVLRAAVAEKAQAAQNTAEGEPDGVATDKNADR